LYWFSIYVVISSKNWKFKVLYLQFYWTTRAQNFFLGSTVEYYNLTKFEQNRCIGTHSNRWKKFPHTKIPIFCHSTCCAQNFFYEIKKFWSVIIYLTKFPKFPYFSDFILVSHRDYVQISRMLKFLVLSLVFYVLDDFSDWFHFIIVLLLVFIDPESLHIQAFSKNGLKFLVFHFCLHFMYKRLYIRQSCAYNTVKGDCMSHCAQYKNVNKLLA